MKWHLLNISSESNILLSTLHGLPHLIMMPVIGTITSPVFHMIKLKTDFFYI